MNKAYVFWLTGLSGSGKTTICNNVYKILKNKGVPVCLLDGDIIRKGLCSDLGYTLEDRKENIRRSAEISKIISADLGVTCLCSFITPTIKLRCLAKNILTDSFYKEVYIKCSVETCIKRDPKGNYKKAINNVITNYTGIKSPYEIPNNPDLIIDTELNSEIACTEIFIEFIMKFYNR